MSKATPPPTKTKRPAKKTAKRGRGQPTKYTEATRRKLELLYGAGFTDAQVAQVLNITTRTLEGWRAKNEEYFRLLKDWKYRADGEVERSLYERACGYTCRDKKPQWVESDIYDEETGTWKKVGRWEYAEFFKHYPPDPTSMIFWLKNRQRDRWRDRQEITGDGGGPIEVVEIKRFSDKKKGGSEE